MLFNSFSYIFIFLPLSVIIYFTISKFSDTAGKYWLVMISLLFYCFGSLTYLPLLLLSVVVNYAFSVSIRNNHSQSKGTAKNLFKTSPKLPLTMGLIFNIGLLISFKYADFFIANTNQISGLNISFLRIAIPLAISFYTFQQITYLVDTYRNEIKETNFLRYCIFVTFFPKLLVGPITRYNEIMPQIHIDEKNTIDYRNMSLGLYLFFIGLCKRVVIADTFGMYADLGYKTTQSLSLVEAWIASLSYTFQIYFDFSGYTDMAIGTAYFFNIKLPLNFNSPYLSINIRDFWRRWHITLSRFMRDYIYIPLGGSRKGEILTYINIIITFLICGFWHGSGWTFIIWGGVHGAALCIHRIWLKFNIITPKIMAIFITFNVVNVAWVFFRANSFHDAMNVCKAMMGFNALYSPSIFQANEQLEHVIALLIVSSAVFITFVFKNSNIALQSFRPSIRMVTATSALIIISLLFLNSNIPKGFIYNDF